MKRFLSSMAIAAVLSLTCAGTGGSAEYRAPIPYADMYEQLKVGIDWRQAHAITRAPELERPPEDFSATDLLLLELVGRRCQVKLLRLHWFRGMLHWVENFQLDSTGVTYQERGNPDPLGEGLMKRLTEISNLYASRWADLTASIELEGSPALQAKAKQLTEELKRRLEELRREAQR